MVKGIVILQAVGEILFLGGIPGMERVIQNDVQAPYVSLVTGPPGAMKSSFCLTLLKNHLEKPENLDCTVLLRKPLIHW